MGIPALLSVEEVVLRFGGVVAVDHVSFQISEGGIYGMIGPNGAGKTSLFNCITGFYHPTSGRIRFMGEDITQFPPHRIAQKGMIRTFQNLRLFPSLTVLENVYTGCTRSCSASPLASLKQSREELDFLQKKAESCLNLAGVSSYGDALAGSLPYGIRKRVEWARALAGDPKLLLLDEPAAGLNRAEKQDLRQLLQTAVRELGTTVLLIEHDMDLINAVCDHLVVLDHGKLLAEGDTRPILSDPTVAQAYLGHEATKEKEDTSCSALKTSPCVTVRWKS